MKTTIITLTACLALSFGSTLQADSSRYDCRVNKLVERLQVDPAQEVQFKALMSNYHQQKRAQHKALRASLLADLGAVLTPGQLEQFEQFGGKHRKRKHHRVGSDGTCRAPKPTKS
ncbi:MAG: hypothetical protein AAF420_03770 [Pseudomonadota bacterium]